MTVDGVVVFFKIFNLILKYFLYTSEPFWTKINTQLYVILGKKGWVNWKIEDWN